MLTYQLQNRVLKILNNIPIRLPNRVEIQAKLAPPTAFGTSNEPSRTCMQSRPGRMFFDANTGRAVIQSNPSLDPIEAVLIYNNISYQLIGDLLTLNMQSCNSKEELESLLLAAQYIIPILLNADFADPPVVEHVHGYVGDSKFRWEHRDWKGAFTVKTKEGIESYVVKSFERLQYFTGIQNRRLLAGLHYFHIACRLDSAGHSPWEFMAEIILNLCKSLQIIFGDTIDDVRSGLRKLGYKDRKIESVFIPIMALRHHFDVGHPMNSLLTEEQLNKFYKYLINIESDFRGMLLDVLVAVEDNNFPIKQNNHISIDSETRRRINKLMNSLQHYDSEKRPSKELNYDQSTLQRINAKKPHKPAVKKRKKRKKRK